MDISEAKVLWNRGGPVKVLSMKQPEAPEDRELHASRGACNIEWKEASDEGRLLLLYQLFNDLTVHEGVSVRDVHEAFLQIDQYKERSQDA